MTTLNLLPAADRKLVQREVTGRVLMTVTVWLLLLAVCVGIVLLWGRFFLERSLADVRERSILVTQSRLALGDEIGVINKQLEVINGLQTNFTEWSGILVELASLVPEGSRLTELTIDSQQSVVTLRGLSDTRETLLQLEHNLKTSRFLDNIDSPLSNLLTPTDIEFEFTALINVAAQDPAT